MSITDRHEPVRTVLTGDIWSSPETADRVLAWFYANADDDNEAQASLRALADVLGGSPATMRRALRRLIDSGHLRPVRAGTSRGYSTRYRVLEQHDPAATSVA